MTNPANGPRGRPSADVIADLAALGIDTIVVPKENEKDLRDVPEEIREKLEIHLVATMDEVLELALRMPYLESRDAIEKAGWKSEVWKDANGQGLECKRG